MGEPSRDIEALITMIRLDAEIVKQRELKRALKKLKNPSPEDIAALEQLSDRILSSVLSGPEKRLRKLARSGDFKSMEKAWELFEKSD